jgi:translation initiation factor IF-2
MGKMRVHELAKEVGMKNNDLLSVLKGLGHEVTNHMSVVDDTQVRRVKAHIAGGDPEAASAGVVQEKRIEGVSAPGKPVIRRAAKAAPAAAKSAKAVKAEAAPEQAAEAASPPPTTTIIRRRRVVETPEEAPQVEAAAPAEAVTEAVAALPAATTETQPESQPAQVHAEARVEAEAEQPAAAAQGAQPEAVAAAEAPAAESAVARRPAGPNVTANRARILDKPMIPLTQLRTTAVREEAVDDSASRKKKPKGPPAGVVRAEEGAPARRRVVTKRRFQGNTLGSDEDERGGRRRKGASSRRRDAMKTAITTPRAVKRKIRIVDAITVSDLAHHMGVKANELVKRLMQLGVMATVNQGVDVDTASIVASEYGYEIENTSFQEDDVLLSQTETDAPEQLRSRPPVVTVMGHVDHGKTSLLDAIREAKVASGEAGGITQHIGAYRVETAKGAITFIDTPGHEAFTAMRARGAQVTDIVVIVVAANDGVMPQTAEAINHAKDAGVPIVVAVNKIDLPDANPERVRKQLTEFGLVAEEWGGETVFENVSAKQGTGIESLLDTILLQAEVADFKANPDKLATGVIIESRLDKGRGPVATVIVKEGTLRVGDFVVAGTASGRVRAMVDHLGKQLTEVGPSMPAELVGLSDVPAAGEKLNAVKDDKAARQIAEFRALKVRELEMARTSKVTLEDVYNKIKDGEMQELRLVIKADVQGSVEALRESFVRLSTKEVKVRIIHTGVGGVNESDVNLASASTAVIICFNVRPDAKSLSLADRHGVEVKTYSIIYDAVDNVRKAMEGLLAPEVREQILGHAEVRQVFAVSKAGMVAGSMVTDGKVMRGAHARVMRAGTVVYTGKISSLRRIKDDVKEVQSGFECGISLDNFNDVKPGDVVEVFQLEEFARTLASLAAAADRAKTASAG